MNKVSLLKYIVLACIAFVLVNYISGIAFKRFDLTKDHRYTLSKTSKTIVAPADKPIIVDVFLKGDIPTAFHKLKQETQQLLQEYAAANPNIKFAFVNPIPENSTPEKTAQEFVQRGMRPEQVQVRAQGKVSQELFFPWAIASYQGKTVKISLLKKTLGATPDELVNRSVQNLEYAFSDAFFKLLNPKSKRIAVLRGNDELPDRYIADFFATLRESYFIAPFPLDSLADKPTQTIKALNTFDLVAIAKPTKPFSDAQKYALDQYIMQGGRTLWLMDMVAMETDSLFNPTGMTVAMPRDLNLNDLFFKYGIRINPVLVEDLYSAPIVLATGEGQESQYSQMPWFYYPLVTSKENHTINSNLDNPVLLNYANQIDTLTLKNNIKKTILLESSTLTRVDGLPKPIRLDEVSTEPDPQRYGAGSQVLSVLLEGEFTSAFKNRVIPIESKNISFRESGTGPNKMIVVADGDVIKNDLDKNGRPLNLGFNKYTFAQYGNKEFLLNAVNYLLDDSGLINIRNKTVHIAALDAQKSINERSKWQALMLGLPLVFLLLFGLVFYLLRRRKN